MSGQPIWNIVEVEKHLVTDADYWHIALLRPKLYSADMQSKIFGKSIKRDQSFSRNFNDIVLQQSLHLNERH